MDILNDSFFILMTRTAWILVIILLYLTVAGAVIVYFLFFTGFSDWLALFALVVSGVIATERIAQWLSKIGEEPRLKIIGSRRESHNEGSEGEYIDIYLLIKNVGGARADDCNIHAMVKGVTKNSFYLNHMPFSLDANDEREGIHFQQIIKSGHNTSALTEKSPKLEMGRIYEYEITFSGANFKDTKKHKLKLDLSSWENIKVILDC